MELSEQSRNRSKEKADDLTLLLPAFRSHQMDDAKGDGERNIGEDYGEDIEVKGVVNGDTKGVTGVKERKATTVSLYKPLAQQILNDEKGEPKLKSEIKISTLTSQKSSNTLNHEFYELNNLQIEKQGEKSDQEKLIN
jgi:hypothetical protein